MKTIFLVLVFMNPLHVSVIEAPEADQCVEAAAEMNVRNEQAGVKIVSFCAESDDIEKESLDSLLKKRVQ